MEECNNFKHFSKESVIDIILICIIGTIFHFAYEFSGRNILVALFSAVNESINIVLTLVNNRVNSTDSEEEANKILNAVDRLADCLDTNYNRLHNLDQ